jgi:hypothetical protein
MGFELTASHKTPLQPSKHLTDARAYRYLCSQCVPKSVHRGAIKAPRPRRFVLFYFDLWRKGNFGSFALFNELKLLESIATYMYKR